MNNMKNTLITIANLAIDLGNINGQGYTGLELALDGLATWERNFTEDYGQLPSWYDHAAVVQAIHEMHDPEKVEQNLNVTEELIQTLQTQVKVLKRALEFYADKNDWSEYQTPIGYLLMVFSSDNYSGDTPWMIASDALTILDQ